MALLDIFKKKKRKKEVKKEERKRIQAKRKPFKEEEKIEEPKKETEVIERAKTSRQLRSQAGGEKIQEEKPRGIKEKQSGLYWQVLRAPHITEKATEAAEKNKYIFKIAQDTNKIEVKKAIESFYGVDVVSVNTIKAPAKKRRLGRFSGWKTGYKKAIVRIKEGQKIEVLPR